MMRTIAVALLSSMAVRSAAACTCVSAAKETAVSQMRDVALVFKGTVVESKLLPEHPEVHRARYAVTFRVERYWKGSPAAKVTLFDVSPGTDCQEFGFEVGKQYLVYALQSEANDFRLENGRLLWAWTDVLPAGAAMLQATACTPGGPLRRNRFAAP